MKNHQHYITCEFRGRLGNNLFMIANCISQGIRHNKLFYLPKNDIYYYDLYKDNLYRKIDFYIPSLPTDGIIVAEPKFSYSSVSPIQNSNTIFRGYFQSEKYFSEYEQLIHWFFSPTQEFISDALKQFPELTNKTVTCINVRRGADYLAQTNRHPVVTPEYIYEAAKHIPNTDIYFVVSDDLPWCKENIKLPNCKFIEYSEWEALWLMSLCHNFIISNSSFSWWAAYLSRNPQKIVVGPSTWCGPDGPQDTHDVFCKNWIRLPTTFHNGTIIPV
jgi:hypothetical protein